jgi:hypothetical protein
MQVFSSNYATTVNQFIPCRFPSLFSVNVLQDISTVTCSELNLVSVVSVCCSHYYCSSVASAINVLHASHGALAERHISCIVACRGTESTLVVVVVDIGSAHWSTISFVVMVTRSMSVTDSRVFHAPLLLHASCNAAQLTMTDSRSSSSVRILTPMLGVQLHY